MSDMSTRIVERDGRAYLVEDGKVVKHADTAAELLPDSETPDEIALGARVEASGKLGKVVSSFDTIYGQQFGVRHDDGETASYFEEDLKLSDVAEVPSADTAIDEIVIEATAYEEMPIDTLDQIQYKQAEARRLNLRAKALASDSKLALSDRIKLDTIVSSTTVDLSDLANDEENLLVARFEDERVPRPSVQVVGGSAFTREDASWLDAVAAEVEEETANTDWEAVLASAAVSAVEDASTDLLKDKELFQDFSQALYENIAGGLEPDEERLSLFQGHMEVARINLLAAREDVETERVAKTAAAEEELDRVDDGALFL